MQPSIGADLGTEALPIENRKGVLSLISLSYILHDVTRSDTFINDLLAKSRRHWSGQEEHPRCGQPAIGTGVQRSRLWETRWRGWCTCGIRRDGHACIQSPL